MFFSRNCWILYDLEGEGFYFAKKILDALLVWQQQFNDPAAASPTALGGAAQLPGLGREAQWTFPVKSHNFCCFSFALKSLQPKSTEEMGERPHSGAGNAGLEQLWLLWSLPSTWALSFHTGKNICTPTSFLLVCQMVFIFTTTGCSKNNYSCLIIIVIADEDW